jgi:hypothetical protein
MVPTWSVDVEVIIISVVVQTMQAIPTLAWHKLEVPCHVKAINTLQSTLVEARCGLRLEHMVAGHNA